MALLTREVSWVFEKRAPGASPGLKLGPLAPGSSALTIRPLRLHRENSQDGDPTEAGARELSRTNLTNDVFHQLLVENWNANMCFN